jgi:hypothetical protein
MAFTVDPQTGKITFGVVNVGTNDGISRDIASEFDVSESFRDQFTTGSSWVHQDFGKNGVNTVTNKIDLDIVLDTTNDNMHHDLQTELGGTVFASNRWTLRICKLNFTTLVTSASSALWLGIGDSDSSVSRITSQDFIGAGFLNDGGNSSIDTHIDNNSSLAGSVGATVGWVVDKDYYIEIVRTDDSVTTRVYDDADFSNLLATDTNASGANALTGLRYLVIKVPDDVASEGGNWVGTIDRIQFWNNATQPILNSREWNARFKLELSNLDGGGSPADKTLFLGLSDKDEVSGSNTVQDFASLTVFTDSGGSSMGIATPDNQAPRNVARDATFSGAIPTVTTYFTELLREQDIESFEDDFGNGVTFTDDFATAVNWVQTGTGVSITGGAITGWGADGADRRVTHDLGATLSDTKWTIDFEYEFTASNIPAHLVLVVSDKDVDIIGTNNNDFIRINHGTSVDELVIGFGDNVSVSSGTGGTGIPISSSTTYFVRLERISATQTKLSVFSDSIRTVHIASSPQTQTITSTVDELRFIHSQNNSGGGITRTLTGTLDNMTVVDGTSGWITGGTKSKPNFSTGVIDWDFSRDATSQGTSYDLGAGNVSETAWVFRFRFHTDNKNVPAGSLFGGVVISSLENINVASDFIGVRPDSLVSGIANFDVVDANNTTINSVGADAVMTTSITAGSTFYVQVRRLSAISYDVSLYSDAGYSNLLENFVGTTTAGVTALRYIVVRGTNASALAGVFDGTIDDIQFWNGITSPDNLTANLFADSAFTNLIETVTGTGIEGTGNLRYLRLFNDEIIVASGAIDGSFDDLEYTNSMVEAGVVAEQFSIDAILEVKKEEFTVDGLLQIMPAFGFCVDAFIQRLGANAFCGVESFTDLKAYWKFDEASGSSEELRNFAHVVQTDFDDDFSTYVLQADANVVWVPQDVANIGVNVSTDVLDFINKTDNTNDSISHDLGSVVSNSAFVLRFTLNLTTFGNAGSGSSLIWFILSSSDGTVDSGTAQDSIGMSLQSTPTEERLRSIFSDGVALTSGGGTIVNTAFPVATHYIEIRRTSTTSYTLTTFSDVDFVTPINTQVETIPSTVDTLRFIKILNEVATEANSDLIAGSIDNVQFWNGVTQVPGLGKIAVGVTPTLGITYGATGQVGDAYNWGGNTSIPVSNGVASDWAFLSTNTSTWTWNTWLNPDVLGDVTQTLFNDRGSAGSNTGINVRITEGSTTWNPVITIRSGFNNGINGTIADGSGIPKDASIHMLTCTLDYAQGSENFKVYIDGVFTGAITKTNDGIGGNQFTITLGRTGAGEDFDGIMDETSVWDRLLSPSEITSLFLLGNAGQELSLETGGAICIAQDALLQATQTQAFTIDVILIKKEEFAIDARLVNINTETFTIDAFIQALGQNGNCGVNSFTGLKAYYTFDGSDQTQDNEASSLGTVPDSLGTDADWVGNANWLFNETGQVGDAYDLTDQGQGTMTNADSNTFSFMSRPSGHTWTWNTWIKPDATSGIDALAGDRNAGGVNNGFSLVGTNDATELRMQLNIRASTTDVFSDTVPSTFGIPTDGSFHMLTMTYDQGLTTNNWKVYNDGVLVHQSTKLTDGSPGSSNVAMVFAKSPQQTNSFNGLMDETSIWDRVLSPDEIVALFTVNNGGSSLALGNQHACIGVNANVQAKPQIPFEFTIDVRIVRQIEFTISAFVEEFGDTERSSVGDLIIRVLQDNPPSLTGLEIVSKCVEFTTITDPTRYDFIGKNSRIKNWIGFLERTGFIEEDDSSPDWYRTNWTLLPP